MSEALAMGFVADDRLGVTIETEFQILNPLLAEKAVLNELKLRHFPDNSGVTANLPCTSASMTL